MDRVKSNNDVSNNGSKDNLIVLQIIDMSINKLFEEFKSEQDFMAMLARSMTKRISSPLKSIGDVNRKLNESYLCMNALYLYLKAFASSDQGVIDPENVDPIEILQTVYGVIQKNYGDFRQKFLYVQNQIKITEFFCQDFIDYFRLNQMMNNKLVRKQKYLQYQQFNVQETLKQMVDILQCKTEFNNSKIKIEFKGFQENAVN